MHEFQRDAPFLAAISGGIVIPSGPLVAKAPTEAKVPSTVDQRLDHLSERVKKLEDIEEIRILRMKYHYFINEKLFDRMHEIYADDAYVDGGPVGSARGIEEISAFYNSVPDNLDFVKQFPHNHIVNVCGDEADGVSYLEAKYAKEGKSFIVSAKFEEKYIKIQEEWKIQISVIHFYYSIPFDQGWSDAKNLVEKFKINK